MFKILVYLQNLLPDLHNIYALVPSVATRNFIHKTLVEGNIEEKFRVSRFPDCSLKHICQ